VFEENLTVPVVRNCHFQQRLPHASPGQLKPWCRFQDKPNIVSSCGKSGELLWPRRWGITMAIDTSGCIDQFDFVCQDKSAVWQPERTSGGKVLFLQVDAKQMIADSYY
jgi:hypothetical protein